MLIEIRLLARLVRVPLLRVEGVVSIHDPQIPGARTIDASPQPGRPRSVSEPGRDLAAAEAILAELGAARRRGAVPGTTEASARAPGSGGS